MRSVDRRATRDFGLPDILLMENAGLQAFAFLQRAFHDLAIRRILLLCGKGNNGGDTFVLARHLHNHRIPFAAVLFGRSSEVRGSAAANLRVLHRLGIEPREVRTRREWSAVRRTLAMSDLAID